MLALEERFMIREMYRKGVSISEIARRTGRNRKTIRQIATAPDLSPPMQPRHFKACKIDPYAPYLEQRLAEGVVNARKLYGDIPLQGYPGKESKVREFVHDRLCWLLRTSVQEIGLFGTMESAGLPQPY